LVTGFDDFGYVMVWIIITGLRILVQVTGFGFYSGLQFQKIGQIF